MKKYFLTFLAVVALLLTSCNKNKEAISVSREVTFEVNPYDAIASWVPYTLNENSITSMFQGYQLRINLLVYDENGQLAASEKKLLNDYHETMRASVKLSDGNYTVVAISDVVKGGEDNCWTIKNKESLSTLQMEQISKYIRFEDEIVCIGNDKIKVDANHNSYNIKIRPAGALMIVKDREVTYWSDVLMSYIYTNKQNRSYTFNSQGMYYAIFDEYQNVNEYRMHYMLTSGCEPNTVYWTYHFVQPFGNTDYALVFGVEDEGNIQLLQVGDVSQANIKEGHVYEIFCDWPELEWSVRDLTNGSKSTEVGGIMQIVNPRYDMIPSIEPNNNITVISKDALKSIIK